MCMVSANVRVFCFLKVTAALSVMFKVDETEPVIKEMFSRFFADLLLRIGVSADVQLSSDVKPKIKPPTTTQYVTNALLAINLLVSTSMYISCNDEFATVRDF